VSVPPVVVPELAVSLIALADCVCELLGTEGAGPTCWCGLYPGAAVSWDYCGECDDGACGMGYVRLAGGFPYDSFPTPVIDDRCAKPLAWAVEVGALRCFPQPADGELPSPAALAEVAIDQALDAAALFKAIRCCDLELAVEVYRPVGPEGMCVGGFWTAYAAVT
jgi:hypothetical protein